MQHFNPESVMERGLNLLYIRALKWIQGLNATHNFDMGRWFAKLWLLACLTSHNLTATGQTLHIQELIRLVNKYYAKKPPFIDVTAVPHLPECSMTPRAALSICIDVAGNPHSYHNDVTVINQYIYK